MKKRGDAVVLIGFMGAGKSSVGRMLARMTGRLRFDTDEMVAAKFGQTILEIFATRGEDAFREAETETLRELSGKEPAIVVTGGGIVLREENLALLRDLGTIIHLGADEETLLERVSRRSTRPLLRTDDPRKTMTELLALRLPLYRAAADVEVDTSRLTHDEVAKKVLEIVDG